MIDEPVDLALDLGSTNICLSIFGAGTKLYSGRIKNSLFKFGPDIITRLSRVTADPALIQTFQKAILSDIRYLLSQWGQPLTRIRGFYAAANTVMLHFLLAKDPRALGRFPFHSPISEQDQHFFLAVLESQLLPTEQVYLPPVLGGYVGADMASALYYLAQTSPLSCYAVVDMGTNAEIAVRHGDRHIVASVAAGPAFGFQGSELIGRIAQGLRSGKIDRDGLQTEPMEQVSQAQIRNLQLAKSAVLTGLETLLVQLGQPIDVVYLAGVFGSMLLREDIAQIHMLPEVLADIRYCGNASLLGLEQMIFAQPRDMAQLLPGPVEFVELANQDSFGQRFLNNTFF